jgi:hypothetical protein
MFSGDSSVPNHSQFHELPSTIYFSQQEQTISHHPPKPVVSIARVEIGPHDSAPVSP